MPPEPDRQIDEIVQARHGDPFSVLGMHMRDGRVLVRTFQPQASKVQIIDRRTGRSAGTLGKVHPAGLYESTLTRRKTPFPYRLRLDAGNGADDIEDPYRFPPVIADADIGRLADGSHPRPYDHLGAHPRTLDGVWGTAFAVWAPNATRVSVVGDFNAWDGRRHPMRLRHGCGVWEIFLPGIGEGTRYKYEIAGPDGALMPLKADPCAGYAEQPPRTASVVSRAPDRDWRDTQWMDSRRDRQSRSAPMSIYEVHLGSWRRVLSDGLRYLTYAELADQLVAYVKDMGFSHIELLPVSEYPFDGSWGYQPVGLYRPDVSASAPPHGVPAFVDAVHGAGLGVLLDWVPGHFPTDPHGLATVRRHCLSTSTPIRARAFTWTGTP